MGYRKFASMNVAIIGAGKASNTLAEGLALAGHEVFLGSKNGHSYCNYLLDVYDNIQTGTIHSVAAIADIIIICSFVDEIREIAYLLDDVRKKVIIDVTNITPQKCNGYATANAISAITGSQHVVKLFHFTEYENLLNPQKRNAIEIFVAGDSKKAKQAAMLLTRDIGMADCYDFGNNDTIPLLEDMSRCWMKLLIKQKNGRKITFKLAKK